MESHDKYLPTVLEEYRTLRDESKQASINMFTSLQWGATVLGIVIAAGLTQWQKEHVVVLLVFFVIIPLLSGMTMLLWLGEAMRFKRVGDYIAFIEQKVALYLDSGRHTFAPGKVDWTKAQSTIEKNLAMSHSSLDLSNPLTWEQWLRNMKGTGGTEGHLRIVYLLRLGFFPAFMLLSICAGTYYAALVGFVPSWLIVSKGAGVDVPQKHELSIVLLAIGLAILILSVWYAKKVSNKLDVTNRPFSRDDFITGA